MGRIQNIYVIGVGAIGASYAGRLYDMNPECVKVVAGGERFERYKKNGIIINDRKYGFNFIKPEEKCCPADLIIIAVKYHHLAQAVEDMRNFVGDNTIIMSLLNGISSEEIIGQRYGMDKMLYATCVGIDAEHLQNNIHFTNIGRIHFGEKTNNSYSEKVEAVKELFDDAGIPYVIPEDMMYTLWWKFMINVGLNQTSALLGAPYGVFLDVKEASDLMESAMLEVIALSNRMGINLKKEGIEQYKDIMKTMSRNGKTSMLQDVEGKRKTEVEMLGGTVCYLGRKYGIHTPVNEMLYKAICAMEKMSNIKLKEMPDTQTAL